MVKNAIIAKFVEAGLMEEGAEKFNVIVADTQPVDAIELMAEFMKENALLQVVSDVCDFNIKGGHTVAKTPQIMSDGVKQLRTSLIFEEAKELADACAEENLELERDAFVDSIYVLAGYSLTRGFAGQISKDWKEVQTSNMSKFCATETEARDTVAKYKRQLTDCKYQPCQNGGFVVLKVEDGDQNGKILKSLLYTEANFKTPVQELDL